MKWAEEPIGALIKRRRLLIGGLIALYVGLWLGPGCHKLREQFSPRIEGRCLPGATSFCVGKPLERARLVEREDYGVTGLECHSDGVNHAAIYTGPLRFPEYLIAACPMGVKNFSMVRGGRFVWVEVEQGVIKRISDEGHITLP